MLILEDVSVIGLDDTFIASRLTPPLTAIRLIAGER
jgi:DNA-binding LacI/PurR family transcriptional regulator